MALSPNSGVMPEGQRLTEDEMRVLEPLARGHSIAETAALLGMSSDEVSVSVSGALGKLSVPSADALLAAFRSQRVKQ